MTNAVTTPEGAMCGVAKSFCCGTTLTENSSKKTRKPISAAKSNSSKAAKPSKSKPKSKLQAKDVRNINRLKEDDDNSGGAENGDDSKERISAKPISPMDQRILSLFKSDQEYDTMYSARQSAANRDGGFQGCDGARYAAMDGH